MRQGGDKSKLVGGPYNLGHPLYIDIHITSSYIKTRRLDQDQQIFEELNYHICMCQKLKSEFLIPSEAYRTFRQSHIPISSAFRYVVAHSELYVF